MSKQKFCIIGKPVSHSLSPILHNYWFKKYNINAEYIALEINEENLKKYEVACNEVFLKISKFLAQNALKSKLEGPVKQMGFKRLT